MVHVCSYVILKIAKYGFASNVPIKLNTILGNNVAIEDLIKPSFSTKYKTIKAVA